MRIVTETGTRSQWERKTRTDGRRQSLGKELGREKRARTGQTGRRNWSYE